MSKKSQASILSFFNKKSTIKSTTPKKEKQAKDDRENEENTTPIKAVVKNEPKKSASKRPKIENTSKKIENELPKPQIESDSEDDVPKRSKRKRAIIESGILIKIYFLSLKDSESNFRLLLLCDLMVGCYNLFSIPTKLLSESCGTDMTP